MFGRRRRARRGRVDVGRYVAPEPVTLPTIEAVADEGMMLAVSAVRMPVKNRLILRALRDKTDYDQGESVEYARERMLHLAREKEADADRTRRMRGVGSGEEDKDAGRSRRREKVSRLLAARLREASVDDELLTRIVDEAREAAWEEISKSWMTQFATRGVDTASDEYRRNRDIRLQQLIRVDLAQLERDAEPEY
ncbi:MAG: hypothetical protein ABW040_02325 [Microbacteriaceae bacterium]